MAPKKILVLGGGFAGMWSAAGARRKIRELGLGHEDVEVTLVDKNPYHSIRVRNYEDGLDDTITPLVDILGPIGVRVVQATVVGIDHRRQLVRIDRDGQAADLSYDRLVFALGSHLHRPAIPGLAEHSFDVDTYASASRLNEHIASLSERPISEGRNTVLVVGSGFTGLEVATELPKKLRRVFGDQAFRVLVADVSRQVAPDIGDHARPVIEEALSSLEIETWLGVSITEVTAAGVSTGSVGFFPTETVIWCAGMRASPMTLAFPVTLDRFGRLPVDPFMRVESIPNVFAAGDSAWSFVEPDRPSVMSCQHGRPMGRFAGHNVVADLFGTPMLPLEIDWYVTVLDLGMWGGLYTVGWERRVLSKGLPAKETKRIINQMRICPPRTLDPDEVLAAAIPEVQSPPAEVRQFGREIVSEVEPG